MAIQRSVSRPQSAAAVPPAAPDSTPSAGPIEELGQSQAKVLSIGYAKSLDLQLTGDVYEEWMPRIARSADGLVPVIPCIDLTTGEEAIFILPGIFRSWLRKQGRTKGLKVRVHKLGQDKETGAWKIGVERL